MIEPRPRASFILPRVSVHAVCHTTHGGQPAPVPRGRRGGRCLPQPVATPQSARCMLPTTSQTSPPGAPRHANPHVRARDTLCANACGKAEDATGAAISSRDADGAACMLFGAMRGYDAHAHPCATTMKQCWAAPSQGHGRPTQRRPVRHTTRREKTLRTCDGNTGSHRGSVGTGHLADQSATLLPQTSDLRRARERASREPRPGTASHATRDPARARHDTCTRYAVWDVNRASREP